MGPMLGFTLATGTDDETPEDEVELLELLGPPQGSDNGFQLSPRGLKFRGFCFQACCGVRLALGGQSASRDGL